MDLKLPGEPHLMPRSEVPLLTWLLLPGSKASTLGSRWTVQEPVFALLSPVLL